MPKTPPPPAVTPPPYYTVKELAGIYDVNPDTVYDWLLTGELSGFKLGRSWRVHPDDWDKFIARRRGLAS